MVKRAMILTTALVALLSVAGCRGPDLETRTFRLRSLDEPDARDLISPYVFEEREGAPGALSVAEGAITVRELPENLDRIEEVLQEFDRAQAPLKLRFQLIEADGDGGGDPAIAEVEEALREVLRYDGYRLVGSSVLQVHGGSSSQQTIRGGQGEAYRLFTEVRDVWGTPDSMMVQLAVALQDINNLDVDILSTEVAVPVGKTVVLGTGASPDPEIPALVLAVTPEIER